jgi:hypothetical protein
MIPVTGRESCDVSDLTLPKFLTGNTSTLEGFFLDQERNIPGNPEIPEVFPARKLNLRIRGW